MRLFKSIHSLAGLSIALIFACFVIYGAAQSPGDPLLIYKNGKWGYIDKTGKIIIDLQYKGAGDFSEGLAAVKIGKKFGYIDKIGFVIIPAQFEYAEEFHDGLAEASVGETTYGGKGSVIEIGFHGKTGYIDKTGTFFNEALCWYSDGLFGD